MGRASRSAGWIALLTAVAIGGTSVAGTPEATSSSSDTAVSKKLGNSPKGCPGPKRRPHKVNNRYGKVVGAKPLWAGMYAARGDGRAYSEPDAPRRRHGWRIKTLWVMHPDNEEIVRVRGRNVSTGEPIWFRVTEDQTKRPFMDPEDPGVPGGGDGEWKEYPSYFYFPRAGCYRLKVKWDGGVWRFGFGFGS